LRNATSKQRAFSENFQRHLVKTAFFIRAAVFIQAQVHTPEVDEKPFTSGFFSSFFFFFFLLLFSFQIKNYPSGNDHYYA
jgi:hypothetical protein